MNWLNAALTSIPGFFDGLQSNFHFLRPEWLWGIPLAVILGILLYRHRGSTHWESIVPTKILEALRVSGNTQTRSFRWLSTVFLVLGLFAIAGPTWKQTPVPTTQAQHALVILLDLSPSMLAEDITPDRLTRVKYKLIDILRARQDGQTGLIAYAGSPHRVSPLTDDTRTIEALLPALHPVMMPVTGSDTESAVALAVEMIASTGVSSGDILLITDGVAPEAQKTINDLLSAPLLAPKIRLSILGVGSTEAVPIPRPGGGFISDNRGEIVLTELNRHELQILAGSNAGRYVEIQNDDSDVRYLIDNQMDGQVGAADESNENLTTVYDSWDDVGYYLILLLIPAVVYSFRRGVIYGFLFLISPYLLIAPQKSYAFGWDDLWKTPDQQAAEAIEEQDYSAAAEKFSDPEWSKYALYKDKQYDIAADTESEELSATGHYNTGNSQALNGDLEDAIASYDKALELEPDFEDAQFNKEIIEQLLEQQPEQQSQQESAENQDGESDQSEEQQSSDQQNGEPQEDSEQSDGADQTAQEQSDEQSSEQEPSQEENADASSEEQQQNNQQGDDEEQEESDLGELAAENSEQSEEESEPLESAPIAAGESTPEELDQASEQWLRAIPDDPSGLLRKKFEYESEIYQRERRFLNGPPGSEKEQRF